MKKALVASVGAVAFAMPATAMAGETYVGLSAGVALPADSQNQGEITGDIPATPDFGAIPAGTDLGWQTDFDNGFAINGQLGYALDIGFRVELEGSYSEYDVDSHSGLTVGGGDIDGVDVAVLTRGAPAAGNPTVGAVIADGQGKVTNFGIFANIAYDVDTGTAFKPFVGTGLGYQWVDIEFIPSGVPVANDDDGSFAYQVFAGASYELSETAEIFGQLTYRATTEDAEVPLTLLPATLGVESEQTLLSAGFRFRI